MSELDTNSDRPNYVPETFDSPIVVCQECRREISGAYTVRDGVIRCLQCEACKCQQEAAKDVWAESGE